MKNTIKWFGIIALAAVIGFSFIACKEGDDNSQPTITVGITSGKLTITSLEGDWNNNYIFAMGTGDPLIAAGNVASNGTITGVKIASNSAELKVWEMTGENQLGNYSGSDTVEFDFLITSTSKATVTQIELAALYELIQGGGPGELPVWYKGHFTLTATFTSGESTVDYLD